MSAPDLPLGEILGEVFEDLPQLVAIVAGRPLRIQYANRAARTLLAGLDALDRTVDELIDSIPPRPSPPPASWRDPNRSLTRFFGKDGR